MSESNPSQTSNPENGKRFGIWTLICLVIANMIGAGVFTTSGFSLAGLHSPGLVVWAWVAGGVIALAGAVSYGQLIRLMPQSGGEYLFLSRGIHPMLGFVAGWVSMFAGFTGAIAFAATVFEQYAAPVEFRQSVGIPDDFVAILVVIVAALLHGIRVEVGAGLQNVAVGLKLLLLVAFLVFAAIKLPQVEANNDLPPLPFWETAGAFCQSLVFISLSYLGFNAAVYVAEEVGEARRNIPRSLVWGTVIVVALYVSLNFVFVFSADASKVSGSLGDVAAFSAMQLGGTTFTSLFRWIISIALFTSVTSMMMAAPRVYAKMADDGMLPSLFRFQNEAPQYAIVLQVVLATLIVLWSDLRQLLEYLGMTLSLCAAASVSCIFFYRPDGSSKDRPRGVQLLAPIFYIAVTLVVIGLSCYFRNIWQLYAALATFAIGAFAYQIRQFLVNPRVQRWIRDNRLSEWNWVLVPILIAFCLCLVLLLIFLVQFCIEGNA